MENSKRKSGIGDLTQRQIDVLVCVSQFKSSKQIARELGISHHTIDQCIRTIIDKMGVDSRAEAARAFLESRDSNGWSDLAICESLTYQLSDLAGDAVPAEQEPSSGEWSPAADGQKQRWAASICLAAGEILCSRIDWQQQKWSLRISALKQGPATGAWQGNTFVVTTDSFEDKGLLDGLLPASDRLRLTERLRLRDANTLEDRITVEDSANYARPWQAVLT